MRRAFLIGLIICILALGGIGAAFASSINYSGVGILALGRTAPFEDIGVDFVGYELDTGDNLPVEVDGVYISFDRDLHSSDNSIVIFVSLRAGDWTELAYCVALVPASETLLEGTIYKIPCADGTFADPEQVYYVKVTVAENSSYSTLDGGQDYGKDSGVVDMPGVQGQ